MSISQRDRSAVQPACSLAAAMLMAMPLTAHAASGDAGSEAAVADDASGELDGDPILVIGRNEEIDIGTLRGPVIDVPQSISVVSPETLQQRQVTTLADALRNVAGVTTQVGEGGTVNGDQFSIRGQSARDDIFTDGLRDFGNFTRDSFNYESVQVLKGSSSTALGRGVAGGAINTQSKRARAEDRYMLAGGVGTADYFRATADLNFGLNETTGIRVNLLGHKNDVDDRDRVGAERWGFAPSIGFGIGTDTTFDLLFFHLEEDRITDYGVPVIQTSNTADVERPASEYGIARSNFYGFDGDRDDTNVNTLTARFTHQLTPSIELASDLKLGAYERAFRQTVPGCNDACGDALLDGDPATVPTVSASVRGEQRQITRGIQNVTTALFDNPIGGMRSEFLIGWDLSYQTNDREDDLRPAAVVRDIFNPSPNDVAVIPGTVYQTRDSRATDISFFVDVRLWLIDTLSVNAGLRYQHFKSVQEQIATSTNTGGAITECNGATGTFTTCAFERKVIDDLWSPKLSLIWEPSDDVSAYVSYSSSAVPQGNSVNNGGTLQEVDTGNAISRSDLAPEKTKTYDLGLKFALFGNRMLVQTAVYQIDRDNAKQVDPLSNDLVASAEPKQRLRGFEFAASGTPIPELQLSLNYSYIDSEIREAFTNAGVLDTAAIGKQVRYVPEHSLSFWGDYQAEQGSLKGLEIGGGLTYQSKVFLSSQNDQVTPAYVVLDGLIAYNFDRFRLALNGNNLTDKLYYAQVNGGRVVPAAGRSFVLSFGMEF
ncbi:MAG: TonB-dependent siderophore receptor [Blastomonas sp.]